MRPGLLDLAFLVRHVLAHDRVVLEKFHLGGDGLLVLVGRVEVAGAGGGNHADLVALGCHGVFSLDLFAAGAHFGQHGIDAVLVDGTQAIGRHAQLDPAVLAGDPEAALVDVGVELATGAVVGMRDVVTAHHLLAGHLANSAHCCVPRVGISAWPGRYRLRAPALAGRTRWGWKVLPRPRSRIAFRGAGATDGVRGGTRIMPKVARGIKDLSTGRPRWEGRKARSPGSVRAARRTRRIEGSVASGLSALPQPASPSAT